MATNLLSPLRSVPIFVMKTRILHTKFWKDDYISKLNRIEKLAFIYLLTNENVNMCGVYELNDIEMKMWLGMTEPELEQIKRKFHKDRKVFFRGGWVCLTNHNKYNSYGKGEKQEPALKRELSLVPREIKEFFNTSINTSMGGVPILDINHSTEYINHKSQIRKKKDSISSITSKAGKVLEMFNIIFNRTGRDKLTSTRAIEKNLEYWLEDYSLEDIEAAFKGGLKHHFYKNKLTPEMLLRRRNERWEDVDRIGELKGYKPEKRLKAVILGGGDNE